jgi:hypothetical protein
MERNLDNLLISLRGLAADHIFFFWLVGWLAGMGTIFLFTSGRPQQK